MFIFCKKISLGGFYFDTIKEASNFVEDIINKKESLFEENMKMKSKIRTLESKNIKLESELKAIKPILENEKLKPAISSSCAECIYAARAPYSNNVLGCKKDCICEYFIKGDF